MGGPPFPTISAAADAAAFVDPHIAEGSDYIKIIYDDLATADMSVPMLDSGTLRALVAAACPRQTCHRACLVGGASAGGNRCRGRWVGAFVHWPNVSGDFAGLVSRQRAFVIPTLGVLYGICGRPKASGIIDDPLLKPYIRPDLRPMMSMSLTPPGGAKSCDGTDEAMRQLIQQGVAILAGTDSPVPTQTYGASLHAELALLVGAGLTPLQALAAATSLPAQTFGLSDRGRISPGLRADLLLVDGDPTQRTFLLRVASPWRGNEEFPWKGSNTKTKQQHRSGQQ